MSGSTIKFWRVFVGFSGPSIFTIISLSIQLFQPISLSSSRFLSVSHTIFNLMITGHKVEIPNKNKCRWRDHLSFSIKHFQCNHKTKRKPFQIKKSNLWREPKQPKKTYLHTDINGQNSRLYGLQKRLLITNMIATFSSLSISFVLSCIRFSWDTGCDVHLPVHKIHHG